MRLKFLIGLLLISFSILSVSAQAKSPPGCEKHQVVMKRGVATIGYGLPSQEMFKVLDYEQKNFPNSKTLVMGGCIVNSKHTAKVYYCPICRKELLDWQNAGAMVP